MRPLVQPTRSTCGQTCVAMLAGVTVEEAVVAVGHRSPTTEDDLRRGLEFYGHRTGRGTRGIAWLDSSDRRVGHWVVWVGGCYVDPADGQVYERIEYEALCAADGWSVLRLLPVRP